MRGQSLKAFLSYFILFSQEENLSLKIFHFFRNQVTQTDLEEEYSTVNPLPGLKYSKWGD